MNFLDNWLLLGLCAALLFGLSAVLGKIVVGQKAPITWSIRWLAAFDLYILAQAHLGLKVVRGRVIRVLKM